MLQIKKTYMISLCHSPSWDEKEEKNENCKCIKKLKKKWLRERINLNKYEKKKKLLKESKDSVILNLEALKERKTKKRKGKEEQRDT